MTEILYRGSTFLYRNIFGGRHFAHLQFIAATFQLLISSVTGEKVNELPPSSALAENYVALTTRAINHRFHRFKARAEALYRQADCRRPLTLASLSLIAHVALFHFIMLKSRRCKMPMAHEACVRRDHDEI